MSTKHLGSCLCGEVHFEIDGDFESFYLCHCEHCRKDTGTAHAANLFSKSAKIKWISGEKRLKIYRLPSTRHMKCFCSTCGSALPNMQMNGELLVVPAGCLDSQLSIKPTAHIFLSDKANWDEKLEDVPKIEDLPIWGNPDESLCGQTQMIKISPIHLDSSPVTLDLPQGMLDTFI